MKITEKILLNNGFSKSDKCHYFDYCEYYKEITAKSGEPHYIRISEGSNTIGRDWWIHVDNDTRMTCGSIDLDTVEHFNTFMDLLDLDVKL